MKKLSYIFTFLLFSLSIHAQDYPTFSPGIDFSPNLAWVSAQANTNYNAASDNVKFGYSIGVTLDYMAKETYGFATEFRIQTLNLGYKLSEGNSTRDFKASYQYVEIPLALKMRTVEFGYTRFFAKAGVDLSVRTKSGAAVTYYTYDPNGKVISTVSSGTANINALSTPVNLGLLIGMGFEYTLAGSTSLVAGLTYHYGVLDIYKDSGDNYSLNTRYVSLDLGVKF